MITPKAETPTHADDKRAYDLVSKRDDGRCQKCKRQGDVQLDHRQNRVPGNTVPSNLQALCADCHRWKTEHSEAALTEGWAVLRHTTLNPDEWPARRWVEGRFGILRLAWVLYLDEPDHGRMWFEIADIEAHFRLKAAGVSV
jgi:hypothetical protein